MNLQTLVITYEGKRIWDKQLIGTYEPESSEFDGDVQMKLCCQLKTPEIIDKKEYDEGQNILKEISQNSLTGMVEKETMPNMKDRKSSKSKIQSVLVEKRINIGEKKPESVER